MVLAASPNQLQAWIPRVATAGTLEGVFGWVRCPRGRSAGCSGRVRVLPFLDEAVRMRP